MLNKKKNNEEEFTVDITFDEEIVFAYIEFYDPTYSPGWNTPQSYPDPSDSHQIACGVLVADEKDHYIIATAKGKNVGGEDVLNPFLIFKSSVINFTTFTKESINENKTRGKVSRSTRKKV